MAGHSKWANIKHRKGKADAKKGKIFSRCAKEIISAVKVGGPDKNGNPRLRLAIEKAKENNVPNEIIERNIKKASSADQADYVAVTYELYGHGGVGIVVEAMTDNKNRTASDMRIATNKRGGVIANPGAVTFNFDTKGLIEVARDGVKEEDLFLASTDAGAEDFEGEDEAFVITTDPTTLLNVKKALQEMGYNIVSAEVSMLPKVEVECDEENQKANLALIDWLEELEDVDSVWHNMTLS
jgi:YebC/PmpR family DNA-binding regulatory protein